MNEVVIHQNDAEGGRNRFIFVLLLLLPIASMALYGGVDTATWTLISVAIFLLTAWWLAGALRRGELEVTTSLLPLPIVLLGCVGLIQLLPLFKNDIPPELPGSGAAALSLDPFSTLFLTIRIFAYAIFLTAALTFLNRRRAKIASLTVVIAGSLFAFFAILQRIADPDTIYGLRTPFQAVPFGPLVNSHHFAAFMEMTGALCFAMLLSNRIARQRKVLVAVAFVVMAAACLMTGSRGGLLSFSAGLVFVFAFGRIYAARNGAEHRSRSLLTVAALAFAGVIVVISVVLFAGGDGSLLRGLGIAGVQDDVSNGRTHFWSVALRIFIDHPLLGTGLDTFGYAFPKYDTWPGQFRVEQAHNDYLQMLADAGIIGFGIAAAFIYLLFSRTMKQLSAANGADITFRIGALGGCFAILLHSFVDFPLRTPADAFFFLLLAAIAAGPASTDA